MHASSLGEFWRGILAVESEAKQSPHGTKATSLATERPCSAKCRSPGRRTGSPLWPHPAGCDFARGGRLTVKPYVAMSRTRLLGTSLFLIRYIVFYLVLCG